MVAVGAEGDVPIEQFKRKGMSDEEVEAEQRRQLRLGLGEQVGSPQPAEEQHQQQEQRQQGVHGLGPLGTHVHQRTPSRAMSPGLGIDLPRFVGWGRPLGHGGE